jgi:hypothetical protein
VPTVGADPAVASPSKYACVKLKVSELLVTEAVGIVTDGTPDVTDPKPPTVDALFESTVVIFVPLML